MKKTILIIALSIVACFTVEAQNEAFKADALKLTKMSSDAVETSLSQVYTMIPEDSLEAFKKDLKPIMDDFYVKLAEKSMEYYTHDEVKELLDFYNSDIGQKTLEVQEKLTKATMSMGQDLNMKLMPLIQKYTQN